MTMLAFAEVFLMAAQRSLVVLFSHARTKKRTTSNNIASCNMSNNEQYAERETSLDPIRLREFDNREGQDPTPTRSQLFEHSPIRMALEGLRPTAWSGAVSEPVGDDGGIDGGEDDEVVRVNIFDTILAKLLDTFDAMCMHMDQPATSEDQVDKCHRSLQGLRTARTLCIQAIGRPLTDTLDAIPGRRTAVKTILGQLTLLVGDQTEPSKYHEYSQSLKEAMRCDSRHLFGGSYIMTIISNEDFWVSIIRIR